MRLAVALMVAALGFTLLYCGLRQARQEATRPVDRTADQFVAAFLAGDSRTMASILDRDSHADLGEMTSESLQGVRYRLRPAVIDGDRATADVTFVASKDFMRGTVFCALRPEGWRILGLRIEDKARQRDRNAALDRLNDQPGVSVAPL